MFGTLEMADPRPASAAERRESREPEGPRTWDGWRCGPLPQSDRSDPALVEATLK